jgi:hypothetical protein
LEMGMDRTVTERHSKSNKRSGICYAVHGNANIKSARIVVLSGISKGF